MNQDTLPRLFTERTGYGEWLRYVLPGVLSMTAASFYTAVDGFFVSRFVNSDALAAINIIIPYSCLIYAIAMMLATGAGAYISMDMGEGELDRACGRFTLTSAVLLGVGLALSAGTVVFLEPLLRLLGSTEQLHPYTRIYGLCTAGTVVPLMFKLYLEQMVRVDGNTRLSSRMAVTGLIANVVLDALLTAVLPLGILGAGLGTMLSVLGSTMIGVFYFTGKKSVLRLTRPTGGARFVGRSCANGASQFMTEISTGIVTLLFNLVLLRREGEDGVAAITILFFLYYFFIAVYMGLCVSMAPPVSYSRGAGTAWKERELLRYSRRTLLWLSPGVTALSILGSGALVGIFSADPAVTELAVPANQLFSLCYLPAGAGCFFCAYHTAVGRGRRAGVLSMMRCLVFPAGLLAVLTRWLGTDGIWLAIPAAELAGLALCAALRGGDIPEGEGERYV